MSDVFASMVNQLTAEPTTVTKITKRQYNTWKKQSTIDMLQGQLFGQSFCNFFNVIDYRLMFNSDADQCNRIIQREYVV